MLAMLRRLASFRYRYVTAAVVAWVITVSIAAFAAVALSAEAQPLHQSHSAQSAFMQDGSVQKESEQRASAQINAFQGEPSQSDQAPSVDRRLVERESDQRVDAVVIALWAIAATMTVLLVVFLWHTSPRRRIRLAAARSEANSSESSRDIASSEDDATGAEISDDEAVDSV